MSCVRRWKGILYTDWSNIRYNIFLIIVLIYLYILDLSTPLDVTHILLVLETLLSSFVNCFIDSIRREQITVFEIAKRYTGLNLMNTAVHQWFLLLNLVLSGVLKWISSQNMVGNLESQIHFFLDIFILFDSLCESTSVFLLNEKYIK